MLRGGQALLPGPGHHGPLDTMVLWTLFQCYGWREKRLHDFYLAMAKEHRRMREFYEMDDLYPERYKLKEKGIDIEKWQEEVAAR